MTGYFLFGFIFVCIGGGLGVIFLTIGILTREILFSLIGGGIGIIFVFIGLPFLIKSLKDKRIVNEIIHNGTIVQAKIIDYRGGQGVTFNGVSPLNIVVECIYRGEHRQFVVETSAYSESQYPIGARLQIAIGKDRVVIVPKTLEF